MSAARTSLLAFALTAGAGLTLGQGLPEAAPQNPLGQPAGDERQVREDPAWAGAYAHDEVEAYFRPTTDDDELFEGTITVGGKPFPARGAVVRDDDVTRLVGGFLSDGNEFKFTATLRGRDQLILVSNGATHSLERMRGAGARGQGGARADGRRPETLVPRRDDRASGNAKASHVRVGQIYVFRLAPGTEMRWKVTEVTAGAVRYETTTVREEAEGPRAIGEPMPGEFSLDHGTAIIAPGVPHQSVAISGVDFDCLVLGGDGVRTWVTLEGDRPTFPGTLRIVKDGNTIQELVRVDEE